jgi:hypothetical protein
MESDVERFMSIVNASLVAPLIEPNHDSDAGGFPSAAAGPPSIVHVCAAASVIGVITCGVPLMGFVTAVVAVSPPEPSVSPFVDGSALIEYG